MENKYNYKESNIRWLGDIPTHWKVVKIKYNNQVIMGQSPKSEYYNLKRIGLPFLQGNADFSDIYPRPTVWCDKPKKVAKMGDILVSVRAPIGAVNIAEQDYGIGRGLCAIRAGCIKKKLLYYILSSTHEELNSLGSGSTYTAIALDDVRNLPIPDIPPSEQKKITGFLDSRTSSIDRLLYGKRRQIKLLSAYRTAIINQAVTKGLDPDVERKNSGIDWLGKIPKNWQTVKTKYLFNLVKDKAADGNNEELLSLYTDIGVRPRKDLEARGNKASTTDGYWIVEVGDIIVNKLLAWMGAVGYSEYSGVTSPAYDVLRKITPLNSKYYHYLFRCGILLPEMKRRSRGIMEMRLRLYFDEFGQIRLPYPPEDEQNRIVRFLDTKVMEINKLKDDLSRQIELIEEYRTTLISHVITGKIDVRDWKGAEDAIPADCP